MQRPANDLTEQEEMLKNTSGEMFLMYSCVNEYITNFHFLLNIETADVLVSVTTH